MTSKLCNKMSPLVTRKIPIALPTGFITDLRAFLNQQVSTKQLYTPQRKGLYLVKSLCCSSSRHLAFSFIPDLG